MAKCKVCGEHVDWGDRLSFAQEQITKVCESCFDELMKQKGYMITVAPENYKVYIFDNGIKFRQYIPRGPVHHVVPRKEERDIQERVTIDLFNRRLEIAAKRIEQRSE